ncbi:MAG: hypothetical protein ABFS86_05495, partial [Planctomycetota bacterium]
SDGRLFPMKSVTLIFFVLAVAIAVSAVALAAEEKARVPVEFPAGWAGTYKGDLVIQNAAGKRQVVPMEFTIAPTDRKDRVKWVIGYEGQPKRNYELITVDAKRRLYKIDEKNSIEISASLMGGELVSIFSVQGNQLLARYRLDGDELTYEIVMWQETATALTGGREGIPVVQTFTPANIQKAVLKRVEPGK